MFKVLRTDSVHRRGERMVAAGNLELLKNFEFNSLTSDWPRWIRLALLHKGGSFLLLNT